ncbi:hypothetical protein LEP1GSC172_0673 [Leptospira noguchii]|uniref:Uncharacterized protein n=1 Tax=Leptospira noguchii TaxID=28182 RepID=M6VQI7_9LEPT|nr:hypothetical protein LEP1GSC172_0673 [Leptospira noguchii]
MFKHRNATQSVGTTASPKFLQINSETVGTITKPKDFHRNFVF